MKEHAAILNSTRSVGHSFAVSPNERLQRMPRRGKSRVQVERLRRVPYSGIEETLIVDARAHIGPAQVVERKLVALLKAVLLPISQVRMSSCGRSRTHC